MSQVTKPIALDETLQDVVTAIQGITQGGMIVSTGNVGSATQPVYIDEGVPTAGMNFAITTGTPTNPATGLTLQDSQFEKSGNVVVFRVAYKITSNVTLTGGFAVCTLPWTPAYVTRVTRIVGDTNDGHTQNMSYGTLKTDKKLYGGPNDSQSTTGNYIEYYGTYLTND